MNFGEAEIRFLSVQNVLQIHADTLSEEGGASGVRDIGLLESAVAMPQSRFGGEWLHPDLPAMAAAYPFHICQNHAFVDGNKRAAALSTLIFLDLNGVASESLPDPDALEEATMRLASGEMSKDEITSWLRNSLHLSTP